MEHPVKILESTAIVRFQHCDPFNHLNNAEYLNYFVNAREDQILKNYDLDIYKMGRKEGKSWVVGTNQIAYIKPAFTMEPIVIQSQLLSFDGTSIQVEMRMYNATKTELKAVLWSNYVHFNLLKQMREKHTEEFMNLFASVENPVKETTFDDRIRALRLQGSRI